jgi:hypothetical protein
VRHPSTTSSRLWLTAVLLVSSAVGAAGLAAGAWSWLTLGSFYVALVVLGPTIAAWWGYWKRRDLGRR